MQNRFGELLRIHQLNLLAFRDKTGFEKATDLLLDWCLDLNAEDMWELLWIYEAYKNGVNSDFENISLRSQLEVKDAIAYRMGSVILRKFRRDDTWEEMKKLFEFMYDHYSKGDSFSLRAMLKLVFVEYGIRYHIEQNMSLFWKGTENRRILENALDEQDLRNQADQKMLAEDVIEFLMLDMSYEVLDIVEHKINLDWITSQDRDRYTKNWEEEAKKPWMPFSF